MTVQAPLTTGRLDIHYTSVGLTHKHSLWVNLVEGHAEGTSQFFVAKTGSSDDVEDSVFVADYLATIAPMFLSTDHFDTYIVYRNAGGVFLPMFEGSLSVVGNHSGGADQEARGQNTFVFKDPAFRIVKFTFFGTYLGLLQKTAGSAPAGVMADFITEIQNQTAGHAGDFVRSKGDRDVTTFLHWISQSNNHSEKRLLA